LFFCYENYRKQVREAALFDACAGWFHWSDTKLRAATALSLAFAGSEPLIRPGSAAASGPAGAGACAQAVAAGIKNKGTGPENENANPASGG
jgi:hypothetical protein